MSVQIGVLKGQKSTIVERRIVVRVSCIVKCDKTLLFFCLSQVFNWISTPNLTFLHNSSRRHNAVRCNNRSFLDNGSLENHRILSDINFLLDCAGIQGAVVSNDSVSFD